MSELELTKLVMQENEDLRERIEQLKTENDKLNLIIIRGDNIRNNYESNEYQEAVHYNWLDDHNNKLEVENEDLKVKLNVVKKDYWFMINLLERYTTNINESVADCLERMKLRKPMFEIKKEGV